MSDMRADLVPPEFGQDDTSPRIRLKFSQYVVADSIRDADDEALNGLAWLLTSKFHDQVTSLLSILRTELKTRA